MEISKQNVYQPGEWAANNGFYEMLFRKYYTSTTTLATILFL